MTRRDGPGGAALGRVLLPTAGGPHAELAAAVVEAVARSTGAAVTVMHVVPADADEAARERAERIVAEGAAAIEGVDVETRVVAHGSVVDAIVGASADHDLTVIGATQEGLLQELVFGAVPEAVGERAESTVIMAKRHRGLSSRLRRWLRWE